ncbi:phosphotransferase family protein [Paenibacillus harenae]|uniref:phosphotransferase family protein n=1 Tax=Paenibacillus harenae TaxID=306543 RepID=UPI002794CF7D|nr:aminoglycoside phosphotransferase family protein [Paenibacillus harenae]MDQ0061810.1 hygromycin-B 4-O-kinase [Paenibacillus harenae]
MAQTSPELTVKDAEELLLRHWGEPAEAVAPIGSGHFSSVFSFKKDGKSYVVGFGRAEPGDEAEYVRSKYVANLLIAGGARYQQVFGRGTDGKHNFVIREYIPGNVIADLPDEQKAIVLPDLVRAISEMNQVPLDSSTSGFGFITRTGNGECRTWGDYIRKNFAEDQTGTFWENWHELFRTSCLERDIFEEIYHRLLSYSAYNEPHRYFVHNDCHQWNIVSDGTKVTGIIDANAMYGDFVVDIATIAGAVPGHDIPEAFRLHYERIGNPIPQFLERYAGARYYKGLDRLRFYAYQGWTHAYEEERGWLLALPS